MNDRLTFLRLAVVVALASFVGGCADSDGDGGTAEETRTPANPTLEDATWCGDLNFLFGEPWSNWNVTPERTDPNTPGLGENVCFSVFYEPLGDPGGGSVRQPDEEWFEPVRVTYFFYTGASANAPATTCTITGVDENGSELGYSIVIEPENSRCEWYAASPIATGEMVFPYTTEITGTFERTSIVVTQGEPRVDAFSLQATGRMNLLIEETGNWLFARIFEHGIGFSIGHWGAPFAADGPPPSRAPLRGDCGAEGSYRAEYGAPEFIEGADYQGCTDIAAATGEPTVTYDVIDDGFFADNGQEFMRFIPVPAGSCSFFNQADERWHTTIDYDTRTAFVTYDGLVVTPELAGGTVPCRIVWEADLAPR